MSNRSAVQASEMQPVSHVQLSSHIEVADDYGVEGYRRHTVASETAPGHFQETRILSPNEVRQRAYQALRRMEQRRNQLREEEDRFFSVDE
jgi:hypothetical protein